LQHKIYIPLKMTLYMSKHVGQTTQLKYMVIDGI
jgi:hypothetical protein